MSGLRIRSSSSLSVIKSVVRLIAVPVVLVHSGAMAVTLAPSAPRVHAPCADDESWQFAGSLLRNLSPDNRNTFAQFLAGKEPAFRGFAEATGLKKATRDDLVDAFADYWRGRSLYAVKLYAMAADQFNHLIAQPPSAAKLPIQVAAMACLERIHRQNATVGFSEAAFNQMPSFARPGLVPTAYLPVIWEGAAQRVFNQLRQNRPKTEIQVSVDGLRGAGYLADWVNALWDVQSGSAAQAIAHLARLVDARELPAAIRSRRNELRVLLARLYYQAGQFAPAIKQLELVDKQSNELVQALTHLASAQLNAGNYAKAIGAAVSLRSGGLRETFAPEALMVTAMALNELCQFPESLRALNDFKRSYQSAFLWLRGHRDGPRAKERLYPLVVAYLKGNGGDVPVRVASEWIRSPIFITRQEAINITFQISKDVPELVELAASLRDADASDLASRHAELLRRIKEAKGNLKPGQPFPADLKAEVAAFKVTEGRQRHLAQALPEWKSLLNSAATDSRQRQTALVASVESELRGLNQRMYQELSSVLENNDLIEAEIWNGASQDIVWQNAHPEYREMVKSGKIQSDRGPVSSADVYNWGTTNTGMNGEKEIWEDELGAIQANMQNNCANKEKYLKLQQRRN